MRIAMLGLLSPLLLQGQTTHPQQAPQARPYYYRIGQQRQPASDQQAKQRARRRRLLLAAGVAVALGMIFGLKAYRKPTPPQHNTPPAIPLPLPIPAAKQPSPRVKSEPQPAPNPADDSSEEEGEPHLRTYYAPLLIREGVAPDALFSCPKGCAAKGEVESWCVDCQQLNTTCPACREVYPIQQPKCTREKCHCFNPVKATCPVCEESMLKELELKALHEVTLGLCQQAHQHYICSTCFEESLKAPDKNKIACIFCHEKGRMMELVPFNDYLDDCEVS